MELSARAGLGHATPHVMRRAFADFIQGATDNLRLTQEMLGHSNPGTTATYLSGMSPEALSLAVQGLSIRPTEPVTLTTVAVEEVGE
jgi:integrase